MPRQPPLTVVVPTHNTRELTLRALAALWRNGVEGMEVVLVDDASEDGTDEATRKSFPRVRVIRSEAALGFTASANLGLEQARGETLLLLNSDTEVDPTALATVVAAFETRPRLGVAGAQLYYRDGSPQWSGGATPTLLWLFTLASGLPKLLEGVPGYRRLHPLEGRLSPRVDWVSGAAMAIRRQVLERVGALDESFQFYCQDLDYCLRTKRAGWDVALLTDFRVLHHHGSTIRQRPGVTLEGKHVALLWQDLRQWAVKEGDERWARRVETTLRLGGRLRLAGRALRGPFVTRSERPAWRAESTAVHAALTAISSGGAGSR